MSKSKFSLFTFFFIFITTSAVCQDASLKKIVDSLQKKINIYAQEKIHLHLDKPYYVIGDDIWFKAYIVDTKTEMLSDISKVLYVDLITPNNSIAKSLKLPIISGLSWGDIKLADFLQEGNYRIRAYTQWMRNFDPETFFDKTIAIGNFWSNNIITEAHTELKGLGSKKSLSSTIKFLNKSKIPYADAKINYKVWKDKNIIKTGNLRTNDLGEIRVEITDMKENLFTGTIVADITMLNKQTFTKEIPLLPNAKEIDVQFLPEGGLFIENLRNKIGIKTVNIQGIGISAKGTITDTYGNQILSFETNKLGLGSFYITPSVGETYTANLKFDNGETTALPLPKAQKTGTVLSVNNLDDENLQARIYFSKDLLNTGTYYLVSQSNNNILFLTSIKSDKQIVQVTASKKNFSPGIVQLTLLSENLSPLNERIIFIKPPVEALKLFISKLSNSYLNKEKIDLSIYSTSNNTPVQGNFSLSVTDNSTVDEENESSILSNLLLTTQLNGYVERPNYYFLDNWQQRKQELDNLLLTQGWRKFEWKNHTTKNFKLQYDAQKGLELSGTIYISGKPMQNEKVTMISVDSNFVSGITTTDSLGKFKFEDLVFKNNLKFIIQASTGKNKKTIEIKIDSLNSQPIIANRNIADWQTNVNQHLANYLEQKEKMFEVEMKDGLRQKPIMLEQVEIIKETKPEVTFSSNLNGAGRADAIFTRKDLEKFTIATLADFLLGKGGLIVMNGEAYIHGGSGPATLSSTSPSAMKIMIDGIFTEHRKLGDIYLQEIESIEILKSPSLLTIYGSRGASGIIALTTRRGGGGELPRPNVTSYTLQGYSPTRIFYSPKYDVNPIDKPDLRTTVFWEPNLITDKDGKAKISYFNTDVPGVYRIVIEGIDVNGSLARKVLTYEVK